MNDYRGYYQEDPLPEDRSPLGFREILARLAVAFFVLFFLGIAIICALAKDTGEFDGLPGAKEWFQGEKQKSCCDLSDGHRGTVRRVGEGKYEAKIGEEWFDVPKSAVTDILSPFGFPVIFYSGQCHDGRRIGPCIRCLMLPIGI